MPDDRRQLLERAVLLLRRGQHAFGMTSWRAFTNACDLGNRFAGDLDAAYVRADYLRVADILEYGVLPLLSDAPVNAPAAPPAA